MLILISFCCQVFLALSFGGYPIFSTYSFMLIQGMPINLLKYDFKEIKEVAVDWLVQVQFYYTIPNPIHICWYPIVKLEPCGHV